MKKVTIKKAPRADGGLQVEGDKYTSISEDMIMLNGKKHKDGGTKLSYGGKQIEAEQGEPVSINSNGEAIIFGNMRNPLTNNKFKNDAKNIGKKEAKMSELKSYGTGLVNNSNPYDRWDVLKFNAGRAMAVGADKKQKELKQSKEQLAIIQDAMLERADELGVDAESFSKGTLKKAQNGAKLSLAERNNNPGNLKYAAWMKKYGAVKGDAGTDGGNFAVFPSVEAGQQAMVNLLKDKKYQNKDVYSAISTWTGGSPYKNIPQELRGKKVRDLNSGEFTSLLNTITQGEDSKLYNWNGVERITDRKDLPGVTIKGRLNPFTRVNSPQGIGGEPTPQRRRITPGDPYSPSLDETPDIPVGTDAERFNYSQIVPELYAAATNRVEPVFAQKYSPNLLDPYNISLQDRRNNNASTFRAVSQRLTDNPAALSTLAGQKYESDNAVNAEEFRINQGIFNEVTNKNTQLLNDASLQNLRIADTQYVRQSEAKSKTKATNQAVLNSIFDKVAKHSLENRTLQTYENLYPHFRYGENYQLEKEGNPGQDYINWGGIGDSSSNPATSTRVVRDANGNVIRSTESTPSRVKQELDNTKLNKSLSQLVKEGNFLFNTKTKEVENRYNNNYSPLKGYDYSK